MGVVKCRLVSVTAVSHVSVGSFCRRMNVIITSTQSSSSIAGIKVLLVVVFVVLGSYMFLPSLMSLCH